MRARLAYKLSKMGEGCVCGSGGGMGGKGGVVLIVIELRPAAIAVPDYEWFLNPTV